ncbi:uncharacterized protein LOC119093953 [Pollicipes pollicipes]|uniref:uncharacterized protein LOC119093953 n=1 Tax=Pollicipes pollicipes TaxID=41117 RepID=UPI001884A876|nr:uncharacterized protein LOC119093953 [Pollicipes pollicipes]
MCSHRLLSVLVLLVLAAAASTQRLGKERRTRVRDQVESLLKSRHVGWRREPRQYVDPALVGGPDPLQVEEEEEEEEEEETLEPVPPETAWLAAEVMAADAERHEEAKIAQQRSSTTKQLTGWRGLHGDVIEAIEF